MLTRLTLATLLISTLLVDAKQYKSIKEDPHLLVATENGAIKGTWNKSVGDTIGGWFGSDPTKLSRNFLGIPFAAPPVGPNRFRSPQPITSNWGSVSPKGAITGNVREATSWPKACKQNFLDLLVPDSEDCLYLNVFTPPPRRVGDRKLPVMVWIYGGAFFFGDSHSVGAYNAKELTDAKDVVLVTLNHRVGALGFFDTDETGANFGIEDQRAALEWVKRNVRNFGGDPDNVTLFGVSSGATSAAIHLTSPLTKPGLIHKVIHQSGPLGTEMRKRKDIQKSSRDLADSLGCLRGGKVDVECMRRVDAEKLVRATKASINDPKKSPIESTGDRKFAFDNNVADHIGDQYIWWPSIDGKNIVDQPRDLIQQGKVLQIPVIFGVQEEEAGLWFLPYDIPIYGDIKKQQKYKKSEYTKLMQHIFGGDLAKVTQLYPIHDSAEKNVVETIRISTDYAFICPTQRAAENMSKVNKNIFVYLWTQATFPPWGRCLSGACHANEVPYMFQTIWPLIGSRRNELKNRVWNYWTNFAATGNPSIKEQGIQDTRVPIWPRFEPSMRVVQELGDSVSAMGALRTPYCKLWNDDLGYTFEDSMYPVTVGEWSAISNAQQMAEKDKDKAIERQKSLEQERA